jgi:uncharacterized protein (DUF4415 family)
LRTDRRRVDAMKDKDIDYSDIPSLGEEFFKNAELHVPQPKQAVTIRLDRDVLAWFRRQGAGCQTRINRLLREYMKAHQRQ